MKCTTYTHTIEHMGYDTTLLQPLRLRLAALLLRERLSVLATDRLGVVESVKLGVVAMVGEGSSGQPYCRRMSAHS